MTVSKESEKPKKSNKPENPQVNQLGFDLIGVLQKKAGYYLTVGDIRELLLEEGSAQYREMLEKRAEKVVTDESINKSIERALEKLCSLDIKVGIIEKVKKPAHELEYSSGLSGKERSFDSKRKINTYIFKAIAKVDSSTKDNTKESSDIEKESLVEELMHQLSGKLLEAYLPEDFLDTHLNRLAPDYTPHYQKIGSARQRFTDSIKIMQRGQPRYESINSEPFSKAMLETVYQAIINDVALSIQYTESRSITVVKTNVQVIGLVFRQPRIYLIAYDFTKESYVRLPTKRIKKVQLNQAHKLIKCKTLEQYLANDSMNLVPKDFKDKNNTVKTYNVVFDILPGTEFNYLYEDLITYPLSETSQNIAAVKNGTARVSLKNEQISYALIDWLVNRYDAVQVSQPQELVTYIKNKLQKTLERL